MAAPPRVAPSQQLLPDERRLECCNDATGGADGEILEVEINADHATDIRETTTHEMKTPRRTIAAPTNHEMDDDTEKTIAEDWPR